MKNKTSFIILCTVVCTAMLVNSCKKEDTNKDKNTTPPTDCVIAENFFTDVKNIIDEAGYSSTTSNGILSDTTIVVTYDSLNHADSDTITINFGTTNKLCSDGRSRKGKLIATYSGLYNDTATTHTITPYDYSVDNNKVNGIIKDNFKGYNATGHLYFMDTVNGNIINTSGKYINWHSTNKLEYTAGDSTASWVDNVIEISGNASGQASDDSGFSMLINSPLVRKFSSGCRKWLVKGEMQVGVSNATNPYRSINLGEGDCDDYVVIVINGENYYVHTN